jgi:endonuclease YncB( thermonuclease family)
MLIVQLIIGTSNTGRKQIRIRALPVAILWLLLAFTAYAETLTSHVVKVADSDTVTVIDAAYEKHRVRLASSS